MANFISSQNECIYIYIYYTHIYIYNTYMHPWNSTPTMAIFFLSKFNFLKTSKNLSCLGGDPCSSTNVHHPPLQQYPTSTQRQLLRITQQLRDDHESGSEEYEWSRQSDRSHLMNQWNRTSKEKGFYNHTEKTMKQLILWKYMIDLWLDSYFRTY